MDLTIQLTRTGGPDILTPEPISLPAPGAGQVLLEQHAIGVNYLDITQRKGAAPIPLPSGLGLEAAGKVAAVGPEVENVKVGDRVAYATGPIGAYATVRLYPADRLVAIPDSLAYDAAAAIMFKGITAQYLLKSTYAVGPGTIILLYGVGGGLGQIMAPWAKHLGAFVIGVVSKPASVARARALGCDDVLVFDADTLAANVARITQGRKVDVVYDPIGKRSFTASLDSLRPRGLMVSFGASSGTPDPVEMATLNAKGSLFVTRPSLAAHTASTAEYQERAHDVLRAVADGVIVPKIWRHYPLSQVADAHADLENGRSAGTIILTP